jgi:hypothetical protein
VSEVSKGLYPARLRLKRSLSDPYVKTSISNICGFVLLVITWIDARRIGAKAIKGYFGIDGWPPWQLSLLPVLINPVVGFGVYLSLRKSIRRNTREVDAAEIESCLHPILSEPVSALRQN